MPVPKRAPKWLELSSKEHPGNGKVCPYCLRLMRWDNFNLRPTIDHRIPKSRGGTNLASNRLTVCWSCNQSKGNHTVLEWLMLLLFRKEHGRAEKLMQFMHIHKATYAELEAMRAAVGTWDGDYWDFSTA